MMLKKMVDEYEAIKGKMNEAKKQFGSHHYLVEEYRNQLNDLCNRYFGPTEIDWRSKKEKKS
ncbi:hypothetical protein [Neobacillus niacini]|uniref:hypothetical protein n=1 Tax=Neobacillus niacini TaxID=86668 RepID=UPI003983421A